MKTALTIAGSDPTGGAGVQLDLRVFHQIGVHGLSIITAITAQNTTGVQFITPVKTDSIKSQIEVLLDDITVNALKTGMLYKSSIVDVVSNTIERGRINNVVVDPVIVSSSGMPLVEEGMIERMIEVLLPLTRIITPNIYEASLITGINIEGLDDLCSASKKIRSLGPEIVIITGWHFSIADLETSDLENKKQETEIRSKIQSPKSGIETSKSTDITLDLYYDGNGFHRMESEKFLGEYHGTGCAFSAALTAHLSLGKTPLEAARMAKEFVTSSIRRAYHIGRGMGILNVTF